MYAAEDLLDDGVLRDLVAEGLVNLAGKIADGSGTLVPNPTMDISVWIESSIFIPVSVSTRSGMMVLTPVQRIICRKLQRAGVKRFTFLKTPRMGSTLFMAALLLYFACHEGVDVLYYERTVEKAQEFHDKKLSRLLAASDKLEHLIRPDGKAGVQNKWTDNYLMNGAALQLRSAFGKGTARSIRAMFLAVDEASSGEYQPMAEGEGNKIDAIWKRAQEFADAIMYIGGTPTTVGSCIVSEEFAKGDQATIEMPFPCCGGEWWAEFVADVQRVGSREDRRGPGLRYIADDDGKLVDYWYECGNPECRGHVEETSKVPMMEQGRERRNHTQPDQSIESLMAWMAYSTDPQGTWADIVKYHFETLSDPTKRQTFDNLFLAKAWRFEPPRMIPVSELEKRAENYGGDLPEHCTDVFFGIDNQEGGQKSGLQRSEIVFYGVGPNQRRAFIRRIVLSHDEFFDPETGQVEEVPLEPFTAPWARRVYEEVDKGYVTPSGRIVYPTRGGCDVGWRMHEALSFCADPESRKRKITPVRGKTEKGGARGTILPPVMSTHGKSKLSFFMVGGQTAKDYLYDSFTKMPGTAHSWQFPDDISLLGEDFYQQLLSEGLVEKPKGSKIYVWDKVKQDEPNEVLDCTVYAFFAELLECKRNRVTKKRLSVSLAYIPPPDENQGLSATVPADVALAIMDTSVEADEPAGGENVVPSQPAPPSINSRVVPRKPRSQPTAAAAPVRRSPRRAAILDW